MLTILKDYFVKARFKKKLHKKKHFRSKISLKNVENALVILPEKMSHQKQLSNITRALKISQNKITTFIISEKPLKNDTEKNHFSKKDFHILGGISNKKLKEIIEKKYSVLINLNSMLNYYSDYLNLQAKADLKIGFAQKENATIADLLISVKHDELDLFCGEVEKYIKILQSKNNEK